MGFTPTQSNYPDKWLVDVTRWGIPGWFFVNTTGQVITAGRLYYIPIFVRVPTTYLEIGINVETGVGAASLARLGLYTWSNGLPDNLLLDAGTVSLDLAGGKGILINQPLGRRYYVACIVADDTPELSRPGGEQSQNTPVEGIASTVGGNAENIIPFVDGRVGDVAGGLPTQAPTPSNVTTFRAATVFMRDN